MFSIVYGVLHRLLRFPDSDRFAFLFQSRIDVGQHQLNVGVHDYVAWREAQRGFEDLSAFQPTAVSMGDEDGAERISAARISANVFPSVALAPTAAATSRQQKTLARARAPRSFRTRSGKVVSRVLTTLLAACAAAHAANRIDSRRVARAQGRARRSRQAHYAIWRALRGLRRPALSMAALGLYAVMAFSVE